MLGEEEEEMEKVVEGGGSLKRHRSLYNFLVIFRLFFFASGSFLWKVFQGIFFKFSPECVTLFHFLFYFFYCTRVCVCVCVCFFII